MEKFWDFFTLRPSDLITTLTYVLKDNFCPCLIIDPFNFDPIDEELEPWSTIAREVINEDKEKR